MGRSARLNSSFHAESMKMLLNLLSNEAMYLARGCEPGDTTQMNMNRLNYTGVEVEVVGGGAKWG